MVPEALGHVSANMWAIMPARLAQADASKPLTEMVGSGPFRFKAEERVPGSLLVYERFADYVPRNEPAERTAGGKVAHFGRVEWRISPDMATTTAYRLGDRDNPPHQAGADEPGGLECVSHGPIRDRSAQPRGAPLSPGKRPQRQCRLAH